jgi:hypothetical protein
MSYDTKEMTERCYWKLQAYQEVHVLGVPVVHWNDCYNVCDGLPIMEGLCKLFKSNRAMITEDRYLDSIIENVEGDM